MSKEFNLDDYQYIENLLTIDEWLSTYKPQPNKFNEAARFDGLLYEHQGEEWDHVVGQQNHYQWTLFQDTKGDLKIKNGLVVRGRVGYFLCEVTHNSHATFIVDKVPFKILPDGELSARVI